MNKNHFEGELGKAYVAGYIRGGFIVALQLAAGSGIDVRRHLDGLCFTEEDNERLNKALAKYKKSGSHNPMNEGRID
jgi:hypothetical protein